MKDALDTNHKITKLITFSPRREAIFRANRQENDMLTDSSASVGIGIFVQQGVLLELMLCSV